jgi:hypothetical protein
MMPVTQKKVINPAMNMNISNSPISARVSFLANTMLIIRKMTGFISWKSWSPGDIVYQFDLPQSVQGY